MSSFSSLHIIYRELGSQKGKIMAQFTNQAQLTYGSVVANSNIATGEILEALSLTKTAVVDTYSSGDTVTYILSILNQGTTALNGLSIVDDLGAYTFDTGLLVPLDYVDGSVKYYIDGVLQASPTVTAGPPLTISGISVTAGGNTTIVYEASANVFAPLDTDGEITNTATVSGNGITPVQATETVTAANAPEISITKSISPVPVAPNGLVSYTFIIENNGNTPLVATDNAVITDVFDPILSNLSITFNGTPWQEGVNYTYNEVSGEFASIAGQVVVDAATYTQAPNGAWSVAPGTSTLIVTGNIGSIT